MADSCNSDPFAVCGYSPATHTHTARPEPDRDRLYAWMTQSVVLADPIEASEIPSPPTFGPPPIKDPMDVKQYYDPYEQILANLSRLLEPGQVVELRAVGVITESFKAPHRVSGYFQYDRIEDMAKKASDLTGSAEGIYFTLNPFRSDLLLRAKNRVIVAKKGHTTSDEDIIKRRWLLVDLDPTRPSGISATDQEKRKAWTKIYTIRDFLRQRGWPEPVLADSGNGFHLLYLINLPVEDDGLIKRVLKGLATKFDDNFVKVDQTVFNPSRITKLYGTQACKGASSPERPHRWSGICEFPNQLIPVSKEKLEALAGAAQPTVNGAPKSAATPVKSVDSVNEMARAFLQTLAPAVSGQRGHNKTFHAACVLVQGFNLSPKEALPLLQEWNKTCSPPWNDSELEHKLEGAKELPGQRGYMLGKSADGQPSVGSGFQKSIMDSCRLDKANLTLEFLVEQVIVANQLAVLGGPKKALKTSIAIDLATSVATGKPFLDKFAVPKPGKVLVCSGESGLATIRDTAQRICQAKGIKLDTCNILWSDRVPRLSNLADLLVLSDLIQQNNLAAVIIDPLYLALLSPDSKVNAANLYDMGPLILRFAEACTPFGATPILVHHTRSSGPRRQTFDGQPLGLEDLSYAGIGEAARQWMVVSRQEEFEQGKGIHSLWLNLGGSAGHSGGYSLKVEEGTLDGQLNGRSWKASVVSQKNAIEERRKLRIKKKEEERDHKKAVTGASCGESPSLLERHDICKRRSTQFGRHDLLRAKKRLCNSSASARKKASGN